MITGKNLIDLGYEPGRWFTEALEKINKEGLFGDEMIAFLEEVKPRPLPLHKEPLHYHKNIDSNTEEEKNNAEAVFRDMDHIMKLPTVVKGAIMPDACPTVKNSIPVGGVVVTENAIHPSMHSADICCSLMYTNYGKVVDKVLPYGTIMAGDWQADAPWRRKKNV